MINDEIHEYIEINKEITRVKVDLKMLNDRINTIKGNICNHMKDNRQSELSYHGLKIKMVEKNGFEPRSKKEKNNYITQLLTDAGVSDPKTLVDQLTNSKSDRVRKKVDIKFTTN